MILLLENTTSRQKNLKCNLDENIIDNIIGDKNCNELLEKFMLDSSIFDKYSTIIIHETIFTEDRREKLFKKLKQFCSNKNLVLFSGNNSQVSLQNNVLKISPVEHLYAASNLQDFLDYYKEKKEVNLLILGYGKKWQLNILLNILEKINLLLKESNEDVFDFDEFENDVRLLELKKLDELDYNEFIGKNKIDYEISNEQIVSIRDSILEKIKMISDE